MGAGPQPLSEATLARHARRLAVPTYDRWSLTPSVVHIGVGVFHRSHQAVYFDDLAELGISRDWGLVGVGLHRRAMGEALAAQDGLYTVVARGDQGVSARVVGVMGRYLFAPDNPAAVVAALAHPRTRLVTLTMTAAGYGEGGDAVALLVDALARRRASGAAPFTVLSCDNLPDNGDVARAAVCAVADRRDPALADWIAARGAFPSSMVDRITPQTSVADRDWVERELGVRDRWPVMTEPYSQWIVEDAFCAGRPPLDRVGVRFVPDVRPYSLMKTRMLNAGHCAIGHLGSLVGYARIDAAVSDPALGAFLDGMLAEEIAPLLGTVPGVDLDDYRRSLMVRFANPQVADPLSRLCRNGSAKVPAHLLSSLRAARAQGRPHHRLSLAVAGWMRQLRGVDEDGRELVLDDPMGPRLRRLARAGGNDPRRLLGERQIFGTLGEDEAFADELAALLRAIDRTGVRAVAASLTAPLAA